MISKDRAVSRSCGEPKTLPRATPTVGFAPDDSLSKQSGAGKGQRILIVEDDFLIASDAQSALREAGFDVVGIAASAEEATELVSAGRPALAIMDVRLTGRRDGIDLALELFRMYRLRCVFATAHIDAESQKRAAAAQPLGWLAKPYTTSSLVTLIQRVRNEI
jgi:DNA-binding NarL/FixJ family response regulator